MSVKQGVILDFMSAKTFLPVQDLVLNKRKPSKFLGASLCFISLPVLKRGKAGLGLEVLAQQAAAAEFQFRGNLSNTLAPVYESYLDFGNDRLVNEFLCCTTSGFLDRNAQIMIADAQLVGEPSYIPVPPGSLTNQCYEPAA